MLLIRRAMITAWHGLLGALLLSGCASSFVRVEELGKPALIWTQTRDLCGRVSAVDGSGTVWREPGGCEDGRPQLRSQGRANPDKLRALKEAFDALPAGGSGRDPESCAGHRFDIFSRSSDGGTVSWTACVTGDGGYDDPSGREEPYRTLAQLFLSLP